MTASPKSELDNSWALTLMIISLLTFVAHTWQPASNKITHGFAAYYTSSRLILDRRGGQLFYDDTAFRTEVESLTGGRASDIYWANPPTTALMFLPLAGLSISNARYIWMVLSLIALWLAMWLSGSAILRLPLQTGSFCIVSAIFFLSEPLAENFRFGQAYVVILALYALALFASSSGLDRLAGLCLGMALALKGSGIPLLVLLLFRGKWRIIFGALLTSIAMALFSLPLIGFAAWRNYVFDVVPKFLADPVLATTAYQTVPGFIQHMFTYHDIWNPNPLVNWPVVATFARLLAGLVFVGTAA
ncbi:MAG TPA: glycosyltransferase family 87 protein, partial [Anaerolineales bacterium]|nr:glycosyltransferase family 87 protein [Anaerolineales bacterium]